MRCSRQSCQHSSTDARSPVCRRARLSSPDCHNEHHCCTPTPNTEQLSTDFGNLAWDDVTTPSKENFPTAPLDNLVWSEDPVPDRHLCIHETAHEPNHQCSFPCHIQKHDLLDGPTTIYTARCSSISLWANGLQWHLIRSSWHNEDNK